MVKSIIWTKKRVIACLLTAVLAVGCLPFFEKGSLAEENTDAELQPTPNYYTTEGQEVNDAANADIALSKTAERIGPDEWEVTVEATIGDEPVQKRKMEFVFVLDISSSMRVCADHDTSHTHDEDCGDLICTLNAHVHDEPGSNSKCYTQCTKSTYSQHWSGNSHKSEYDCVKIESNNWWKYYRLICSEHQHTTACFSNEKLICKNIVHGNEGSYKGGCTCYYDGHLDNGKEGRTVYNRLNVAKEAAENLIASLPAGTTVHRVTFHGDGATQSVESFYGISNGSGTYMMQGINFGINQFSSNSASKKILVVLTDGESKDGNSSTELTNFKNNGGTVFTIGFSYSNDDLEMVASEDGAYLQATGAVELNMVMDQISSSITAMLEDPMSPSVNFIPGSIDEIKVAEGKFETVGQTIYWYPGTEGDSVQNKTIKYSYTVKLNKNDDSMSAGSYQNIDLNDPTYLLFTVTKTENGVSSTETIRAKFPIPAADYSVATLDVKGKCGNEIIYAREKERIIADELSDFDYTPAFATSYAPVQYYTDGSSYYRYIETSTYTADGKAIAESEIDPDAAAAYVVVHEYTQISENEYKNLYPVTYQYTYQPKYAPDCPDEELILKDTENVEVADEPQCEGYAFSGWTTSDVTFNADGTFTMPGKNVVFTGTWTKLDSYQVKVNYYTKTDGVAADTPDGTRTSQVQYGFSEQSCDFAYSAEWDKIVYGADRSLAEGSETLASFAQGENKLIGIVPASPTKVITINLYREVTTSVPYRVVHEYYVVEPDGTTKTLEYTDGEDSAPLIAAHGKLVSTEQNEANTNILANKVTQRTDEDSTKTYSYVGSDPQSDKVNGLRLDKKTPTENQPQTITLKYERKTYSVTITGDSGVASVVNTDTATLQENAASVQQAYNYDEGSKVDVSYTLKDGYRVKAVTVTDGTNAVSESLYTIEGQKISFENLRGNYAVTVETEQIPSYTVTIHYVSENQDKAVLTYSDYISDSALEGSAYDVRDKLLKKIEKDGKTWYYSGVSGDAISGTLNGDKEITVKYYLKPTYTITATYTTVTDGESASVTKTAPVTTGEPGSVIPFDQKDYDNKVDGFTADHFQNGLKVNDEEVTEMPKMKKFGAYEVTLSYRRTVNNPYQAVVRYQDKNNAELQEPETSNKIAFGQPYNMKYAKLETITLADGTQYAFVSDDTDENHTDYTGIMPKGGVEITRTYEKLPSYQVVADYYTKTDGGEYQLDNTSPVIAKDVTYGKESGEAKFSSIYKDNSYSQPQLAQPQDGVTIEDNMVKGITPATPTNVVTVNLYRTVNNPYQAVVRYQDKNNAELQEPETSNKIAFGQLYNMKYAELETITLADGTQYAFVSDDTAENHTDYTGIMPKGGVEIIRIYEKLPSYQVIVNYYTITDGETPVLDNTITNAITYTKNDETYQCETTKANNQYGDAELSSGNAQLDAATALLTKIVPTDTTNVVTVNLYRTVQTPAQYQVSHQYYEVDLNDNRTLVSADSYTTDPVTMNHGDTVAANSLAADPDGKTDAVKYTEVSRTPDIKLDKTSTEMQTITITYERYQAPITVHYVDTEGTPLKEDYTETLFAGDAYDLNTPVVQIIEILKDGVPYDFAYDDTDDDTGYAGVLPREGVEITLVYQKRGKATATVQYVDEDGNALQLPLMTEEMYIGEPYDVSEALQVQQITLGGSEYAFDHHFQTRAPLRSVGSLTFVEDVDYQGAMPPGGIQITRVYRLGKVTYYYQQKNVYTAYDADGNVVYSGTQEFPILTSEVAIATLNALESFEYEGYGFWRVSEETMTADLTGTAPDKPYVFIVYYEFRQGDEPVPDTQLPPGITAPESTPQPTATAPVDTLPPQTGDEGVALWQWLMVLASAGLVLMLKAQRKTRREER